MDTKTLGMNPEAQEQFDALIAMDQESLSKDQVLFLMARRTYMNDDQRKRYADLIKAHEAGTLFADEEEDENDLSTLGLARLKEIAKEEEVEVKGLKTKKEFIKAIEATREENEG